MAALRHGFALDGPCPGLQPRPDFHARRAAGCQCGARRVDAAAYRLIGSKGREKASLIGLGGGLPSRALAFGVPIAYMAAIIMLLPKPRDIMRDTRSFFARRERHSWFALLMSAIIPAFIIWIFIIDSRINLMPTEPFITYVEVWGSDRTDEEIMERQRMLAMQENERRAMRREGMRQLADRLGVSYDRDAAAEADRITEENREILSQAEAQAESDSD